MAHFTIYQDKKKEYRWNLKANNGETIADSAEGYLAKSDCEHGIELVKTLATEAKVEHPEVVKAGTTTRKKKSESV